MDGAAQTWFSPAILHVDMDAFFASVEVLDRPELAGLPVVVGGSGARGVVASCTYEARAYGVRSAMPSLRARQLCPDAIFVDGRYWRYAEVSRRLREIFVGVTPLVEPIGLDEAFLDVTGTSRQFESAVAVAHFVRRRVRQELSLRCSVGVGRSKLIAKLASRAAKPPVGRPGQRREEPPEPQDGGPPVPGSGVVLVPPSGELGFLHPLPVSAVWGVGPATGQRLAGLGVRTVGDLARLPEDVLVRRFGQAQGRHLAALARAEDPDPVVPDRPPKSVGHEETFPEDLTSMVALSRNLRRMVDAVAAHLSHQGLAGRTMTVKVRFADFKTVTRSHTLPFAADTAPALAAVAEALLEAVELRMGVRLLGVSVSGLQVAASVRGAGQLAFDLGGATGAPVASPEGLPSPRAPAVAGEAVGPVGRPGANLGERARALQDSWEGVAAAVEAVRSRYGTSSLGTAAMVGEEGLSVPGRHRAPWGPAAPDRDAGASPGAAPDTSPDQPGVPTRGRAPTRGSDSLSGREHPDAGDRRPPGEGRSHPPGRSLSDRPAGDGEDRS